MIKLNSQYNKAVYSTFAGALLTTVFLGLKFYAGHDVPGEFQTAVTALVMAVLTFLVPNAPAEGDTNNE